MGWMYRVGMVFPLEGPDRSVNGLLGSNNLVCSSCFYFVS